MAETKKTPPTGQRFTFVYGERGKPVSDSARMRRRLSSLIEGVEGSNRETLAERTEKELGIAGPWSLQGSWRDFLGKWDLKDVLNLVTIAHHFIEERDRYNRHITADRALEFLREVQRIFQEENVHYL
jgi:hypothetical protein